MSLPGVTQQIVSGLGTLAASGTNVFVKLGVCPIGVPNALYGVGSIASAKTVLGDGILLEACAYALDGGASVFAMPLSPSTYGAHTGSYTLTGTGAGTIVGSKGPWKTIAVKIIAGGAVATATAQVSIDGGAYSPTFTTASTYQVPGAYFTTIAFGAGTYVANDVYTIATSGVVTRVGSGTSTLLDASTHSPVDNYNVHVKITTSGTVGTGGAFQIALDDGFYNQSTGRQYTYGGTIAIPASGVYVVPDTGLVITFAGAFVAGDIYTNTATTATYSNSDVTTALTALRAISTAWENIHVIGVPTSAANAASLATVVQTQMDSAEAGFRYVYAVTECPSDATNTDAVNITAFASVVGRRVSVAVSYADIVSSVTGRYVKRGAGWVVSRRLAETELCEDVGKVLIGPVSGVSYIYRDETATPGLTEARFTTLRTFPGATGFFITEGKTMAPNGDDYAALANRRVVDLACTVTYQLALMYVLAEVNVNTDPSSPQAGYINEVDAQQIDNTITTKLQTAMSGQVSTDPSGQAASKFRISRTDNLLSDPTANATVQIVSKARLRNIIVRIGLVNPRLA